MRNFIAIGKSLVRMHLVFSGISFFFFGFFTLFTNKELGLHYFQTKVLAITHIATLCWLTPFILALFYAYVPQVFSRKLYSLVLAKISFWLLAFGALMLVHAFWLNRFDFLLTIPAHILLFPFLLLFINVIITAIKSPKVGIGQLYFITSIVWLLLTAIVGFFLAMNFSRPIISASHLEWLKLHANIGFIGWFLQMIIGFMAANSVSTELQKKDNINVFKAAFFLINGGLVFYFFDKGHYNSQLAYFPLILIIAGIIGAIIYLFKLTTKPQFESMLKSIVLLIFLLIPVLLAFLLTVVSAKKIDLVTSMSIIYAVTVILGFIGSWTFNQTNKLLKYFKNGLNGGERLISRKLSGFHFVSYLAAIIVLLFGIATKLNIINFVAAIFLLISSILFNIMVLGLLFQKGNKNLNEE